MDPNIHPIHPALRVAQLDGEELDNSVEDILLEQYKKILENFPSIKASKFDPEVLTIFRSIIWWCSLRKHGCTIGQRMINIAYENFLVTKNLKWAHFGLRIALPYIRSRMNRLISIVYGESPVVDLFEYKLMPVVDLTFDFITLLNCFRFLNCGDYRDVVERILRLHVVYSKKPTIDESDFSGIGRELLWHAYVDVLTLLMPLLKFRRLWIKWKRKLRSRSDSISKDDNNTSSENDSGSEETVDDNTEAFLVSDDCRIEKIELSSDSNCVCCFNYPILASHMGCGHVFCYYCLASHLREDPDFTCPVCDSTARCKIKPVS